MLPTIAALDGATQVTLQIAATDTGGNTTLSAPMVVTLVPDTTPPKLLNQSLVEGENRTTDPGFVTFTFSEPLDPATVSASTFFLVGSDGSKVPVTVGLRDNGQTVELAYNQGLALGQYQLEVDAANVTDRVGNALGSNILATHFTVSTVSQFTDTWIGPQTGGLWTDVANWSAGRVPDASDDVRVDLGPGGTISVSDPESVAALTLTGLGTLSIDAGSLTVRCYDDWDLDAGRRECGHIQRGRWHADGVRYCDGHRPDHARRSEYDRPRHDDHAGRSADLGRHDRWRQSVGEPGRRQLDTRPKRYRVRRGRRRAPQRCRRGVQRQFRSAQPLRPGGRRFDVRP